MPLTLQTSRINKDAKRFCLLSIFILLAITKPVNATALPKNFVYLSDVAPTIQQDIHYAGWHNFVGHPLSGYQVATCILSSQAAEALSKVQLALHCQQLSLKVFDCYRPQTTVNAFIAWSKQPQLTQMQTEFYPTVQKADFFKLGYVAAKSSHTRGSTVDLTIVPLAGSPPNAVYHPGQVLVACTAPYQQRFFDGGLDMGTGFDCMDKQAHIDNQTISATAKKNRQLLQQLMQKNGFAPYHQEWWHFTLRHEPYPATYFNFPVAKFVN